MVIFSEALTKAVLGTFSVASRPRVPTPSPVPSVLLLSSTLSCSWDSPVFWIPEPEFYWLKGGRRGRGLPRGKRHCPWSFSHGSVRVRAARDNLLPINRSWESPQKQPLWPPCPECCGLCTMASPHSLPFLGSLPRISAVPLKLIPFLPGPATHTDAGAPPWVLGLGAGVYDQPQPIATTSTYSSIHRSGCLS